MCEFTEDCDAGEESYWEQEPDATGHVSFGCDACGYSDCL